MKKRKSKTPDQSVELRWTPALAHEGFTPVATPFLQYYAKLPHPLTLAEAMFVVHLMSFKWGRAWPWPSTSSVAKLMGCSERYVRKLCTSLESVGYLVRKRGAHRTNEFDLSGLFAALEKALAADKPIEAEERAKEETAASTAALIAELVRKNLAQTGISVAMPTPAGVGDPVESALDVLLKPTVRLKVTP